MNEETTSKVSKQEKTKRKGTSFLGVLLRILLVLVLGCVIGAAVYFSLAGWIPQFTQQESEPIESNQTQMQALAATQEAISDQVGFLAATLQAGQASSHPDLASTLASADLAAEEALLALETLQAYSYTQIPSLLATLAADQQSTERNLSALATAQMAYYGSGYEIYFVQVLALLSRTNQFLLHNNYGLAEDQLITAQEILLDVEESLAGWQRTQAIELASLLEEASADLPDSPDVAALKIELAWKLALQVLSREGIVATPSPTGEIAKTPTTTP